MRDGPAPTEAESGEPDWASAVLGIDDEPDPVVRPPAEDRDASPLSVFVAPLVAGVVVFGAVLVGSGPGAAVFFGVAVLALLSGVAAIVFSLAVRVLRRGVVTAHLAAGVVGALLVGTWPMWFFGGVSDVGAFPFVIGGAYLAVALLSLVPSALAHARRDGI